MMTRKIETRRFKSGAYSGCFECRLCGKRTRDTGNGESGVGLCKKCIFETELENGHRDGSHVDYPCPDVCKLCREESK